MALIFAAVLNYIDRYEYLNEREVNNPLILLLLTYIAYIASCAVCSAYRYVLNVKTLDKLMKNM